MTIEFLYSKKSLADIFNKRFSHVQFLDLTGIDKSIQMQEHPIVNLDTWSKIDKEHSLRVSRVFNINDGQIYSRSLYYQDRTQLEKIKNETFTHYVLVDDDIATGFTTSSIIKELSPKICLKTISLNPIKEFYDIVDIRDFIFGASYGGLICINALTSQEMRVPYVFPFINLYSRARVPFGQEKEFSNEVISANLALFKGSDIKIKDLDLKFQQFCQYADISLESYMVDALNRFYC